MKISSIAVTLLGSLLIVSGVPIPVEGDEAEGSAPPPQPPAPAPRPAWGAGGLPASVKQAPPGPPVVARPVGPPSYGGHKDKDGDPVKPGDVKRLRSGSDSNPDGHPVVVAGTHDDSRQHVNALPMTHTPPQRWDQNHVKDASSYNVPGVDGTTKIYMKPKKVDPTKLEKWDYNNVNNHKVAPGDLTKLQDDMCKRANGGSCAYRPGAKKSSGTTTSGSKSVSKAAGGIPVKGGVAKPAQKVGGARVQTKPGSKTPSKSVARKTGGSAEGKTSRKSVSTASGKGGKSSVKQPAGKVSSVNKSPARPAGKSSTKAPATQKSSATAKGGRTGAKGAVSQKTPAKSSTRSKPASKAPATKGSPKRAAAKTPISKQTPKAPAIKKAPASKQAPRKTSTTKQSTKAPSRAAKPATKAAAPKAPSKKSSQKAPASKQAKAPAKVASTKKAVPPVAKPAAKPAAKPVVKPVAAKPAVKAPAGGKKGGK